MMILRCCKGMQIISMLSTTASIFTRKCGITILWQNDTVANRYFFARAHFGEMIFLCKTILLQHDFAKISFCEVSFCKSTVLQKNMLPMYHVAKALFCKRKPLCQSIVLQKTIRLPKKCFAKESHFSKVPCCKKLSVYQSIICRSTVLPKKSQSTVLQKVVGQSISLLNYMVLSKYHSAQMQFCQNITLETCHFAKIS